MNSIVDKLFLAYLFLMIILVGFICILGITKVCTNYPSRAGDISTAPVITTYVVKQESDNNAQKAMNDTVLQIMMNTK